MIKSLLPVLCFLCLFGCATKRVMTVRAIPADADIRIDGTPLGKGPITHEFSFSSSSDTHQVIVSRRGYREASETITRDPKKAEVVLQMRPESRVVNIIVRPAAAIIKLDGRPLSLAPQTMLTEDIVFGVDAKDVPVKHTISAERDNFVPVSREIAGTDTERNYVLELQPMKKNVSVVTGPPGSKVFLDNEPIGTSPLKDVPMSFPVDMETNEFIPRKLRAEKPGYETREVGISWDGGKTDYQIDLGVKTKEVKIISEPPGATVTIDGLGEVPRAANGVASRSLQFPPSNENGDPRTYIATVSKKTNDTEWEAQKITIGWENGKTEYKVALKEILTRPVQMLAPDLERTDAGWEVLPHRSDMLAMKDVTEGPGRTSPQSITRLARGTQLGSLAMSPDGSQIVFTILAGSTRNDFRSQMMQIRTDGSSGPEIISDGKSLDMMPSYTPDGQQIIFSSNRAGRRLNIWSMSAAGAPGITRLTSSDTNDLWPTVDSDPKPRLFYQAMVDTRPDPRLYMMQIGTVFQTDLSSLGGTQPRVSPKNDAILFTAINEQTGKRDVYRMPSRGGSPQNLTNTPEADELDVQWSKDCSKIVFASDRAMDDKGQHNYDIWMVDLNKPDQPVQLTTNASHDDSPVFDISGTSVFFRSNRGGEWGIWRIGIR